jgi:N6-adenosine-specific RNA methylase IME4
MNDSIITQDWYTTLVDECKQILTEAVFTSRWALVEGYWQLGKRIRGDKLAQEHAKGNKTFVQDLGRNLGVSSTTLYYALQAYDKYPDIDKIPEGKNISWNKLITKYLPEPKVETPKLPTKEFSVIYADPPWKYDFSETESREIENKYPTMEVEQIKRMKIPASKDAVLFMWATAPKLREALEVIDAWGFEYKSHAIWNKVNIGMGYWFRGQHELLLVATKGNYVTPNASVRVGSVYSEKRTEHSKKPEYYYQLIEKMYPSKEKIELFARNVRNGWSSWGNEI